MYGFHFTLRVLGVGWIQDTQCGFKVRAPLPSRRNLSTPPPQLFTRPAAQALFPPLHLANWIFDVELLLLASHLCIPVKEVPVHWHEVAGSKLNVATATLGMVYDLLVMRLSYAVGRWSAWDGYARPDAQGADRVGRRED
jgi:dolichyl-phosphate beta-glucosyltransferase